ncbi:MAG: hypothetical protein HFJ51_04210, partial [Clostridia bacterium]|nr:hypothetical protein [Clostridia bacterium]
QVSTQVDDIDKLILKFCKDEKTAKEIADNFEYKNIKGLKKNHLQPLIEKGLLQMTIPEKPTSSKQKYIAIK